jgi:hypothetical protein
MEESSNNFVHYVEENPHRTAFSSLILYRAAVKKVYVVSSSERAVSFMNNKVCVGYTEPHGFTES